MESVGKGWETTFRFPPLIHRRNVGFSTNPQLSLTLQLPFKPRPLSKNSLLLQAALHPIPLPLLPCGHEPKKNDAHFATSPSSRIRAWATARSPAEATTASESKSSQARGCGRGKTGMSYATISETGCGQGRAIGEIIAAIIPTTPSATATGHASENRPSKTGLQNRTDILQPLVSQMEFWSFPRFAKCPRSIASLLIAYKAARTRHVTLQGKSP